MTVWDVLTEDRIKAYLKVNHLFLCLREERIARDILPGGI